MKKPLPKIKIFNRSISKIGIGTWGIGGYMTKSPYSDYVNEISQLKYQIQKGLSLIDCWIAQGEGDSLGIIRQAIEEAPRESLTLLCKFDIQKYEKAEDLDTILNQYLKHLNTSYIDVFEIHKPDFTKVSEAEVEKFLVKNMKKRVIRHFAVANANIEDIKNIQMKITVKLEANEILYNIFDRDYEKDGTIKYCIDNDIQIIAYRPLNRGMTNIAQTNTILKDIIKDYTLTPNQMALNWLISMKGVMTLLKSSNRAHINENFDCMSENIKAEDIKRIDSWNG